MKTLVKLIGSLVILLVVLFVIFRITGLNPNERRPGLWLTGDVVTTPVTDWTPLGNEFTLHVQTNSPYLLPHSVTIYNVTHDGHLYLGSSNPPVRHWNEDVLRDPHARVQILGKLYDVTLTRVVDDSDEYNTVMKARQAKYPLYKQPKGTKFILFRAESTPQ